MSSGEEKVQYRTNQDYEIILERRFRKQARHTFPTIECTLECNHLLTVNLHIATEEVEAVLSMKPRASKVVKHLACNLGLGNELVRSRLGRDMEAFWEEIYL